MLTLCGNSKDLKQKHPARLLLCFSKKKHGHWACSNTWIACNFKIAFFSWITVRKDNSVPLVGLLACVKEQALKRNISQTFWHRLPIFQVDLHCALHHVATSSCRGHVDELATEPFLLLHREHGTGYRRSWNCCDRWTRFVVIWKQ